MNHFLASKPNELSARDCVAAIAAGKLRSADLLESCLERIKAREPDVRAWSYVDAEGARRQAREADARRAAGAPLGVLHGLPIGIKDVFDTEGLPSEYGSKMYQGRIPESNAAAVHALKAQGAVIVGKTTTSEFGMYHPSPTRNPVDLTRSPGVSSSGSAAAVVDCMVPLALGTQHTASTTLPASFCGAFAFKPSHGFTSMQGSNVLVPRLSHLGLLARSVDDLALFAGAFDPRFLKIDARPPRIGIVHGPGWELTSVDARMAFQEFVESLPTLISTVGLGDGFAEAPQVIMGLLDAHMAHRFGALTGDAVDGLCGPLHECIERGKSLSAVQYVALETLADDYAARVDGLFDDYDALITLSTLGEATMLEEGPGSGVMSMLWSLCKLPTFSLPLLRGTKGLPIGVQLIGRYGSDKELFQCANWLVRTQRTAADS